MNAYHNMSCPPKSTVNKKVVLVGKQVLFSLQRANLLVPGDDPNRDDAKRNACIQKWLAVFIQEHESELLAIPRPMGYMIGNVYLEAGNSIPGAVCCVDPILTIAILGRMSDSLYIPQREIRLTCHSPGYCDTIAFPAKYFSQFA